MKQPRTKQLCAHLTVVLAGAAVALTVCLAPEQGTAAEAGTGGAPAPAAGAPAAPADLLAVGTNAPDFTVTAHDGHAVTLSKLRGQQVALYFYPKDDTPGCTKEACELRDAWGRLQKAGVAVFGVSTQDNASHQAFAQKYKLPFPLLPDPKGELAALYRVPVVGGKARRITYLIDPAGKVKAVWPNVNPIGHAADILAHARPPAPGAK